MKDTVLNYERNFSSFGKYCFQLIIIMKDAINGNGGTIPNYAVYIT